MPARPAGDYTVLIYLMPYGQTFLLESAVVRLQVGHIVRRRLGGIIENDRRDPSPSRDGQ